MSRLINNGVRTTTIDATDEVTLASGKKITWNADTNVYRDSSGVLRTAGQFWADGVIYSNPSSGEYVGIGSIGPSSKAALDLGGTVLYKNSAGVLQTTADVSLNTVILASVTSDPVSPADGTVWYRSDTDEYKGRANGSTVTIYPASGGTDIVGGFDRILSSESLTVPANRVVFAYNNPKVDGVLTTNGTLVVMKT